MAKQFVVEVFMKNSRIWVPSENTGLTWPFSTEPGVVRESPAFRRGEYQQGRGTGSYRAGTRTDQ